MTARHHLQAASESQAATLEALGLAVLSLERGNELAVLRRVRAAQSAAASLSAELRHLHAFANAPRQARSS
jgi:hypothetical protein